MTDELVEKVARGIYEASGYEAERVAGPDCMVPGFDEDDEDARDFCRTLARAAIEASGLASLEERERVRTKRIYDFIADREQYAAAIRSKGNQHANGIIETLALLRTALSAGVRQNGALTPVSKGDEM